MHLIARLHLYKIVFGTSGQLTEFNFKLCRFPNNYTLPKFQVTESIWTKKKTKSFHVSFHIRIRIFIQLILINLFLTLIPLPLMSDETYRYILHNYKFNVYCSSFVSYKMVWCIRFQNVLYNHTNVVKHKTRSTKHETSTRQYLADFVEYFRLNRRNYKDFFGASVTFSKQKTLRPIVQGTHCAQCKLCITKRV